MTELDQWEQSLAKSLHYQDGSGSWWSLDAEVVMEEGRIICTKNKTGHALLVEGRFEFPGGEYREQQTALQEGKYFNSFHSLKIFH